MYPSVQAAFCPFTESHESRVPYLYLDLFRLVTTALGCKVDSIAEVQRLDFLKPDGKHASQFEIMAAWRRVKNDKDLDPKQGGAQYAALTDIRITPECQQILIDQRIRSTEATVKTYFPGWATLPADAQLLIMSMAWAMGPHFPAAKFPKFTTAVNADEWQTAAAECQMDETDQNDSFKKRNAANLSMAKNSAIVVAQQIDRSVLQWPLSLEG